MVIVVEDTDRNGSDFDQKHIEAMLHRFRSVERISFILTAGNDSRIDFPKVAEWITFLPPLPISFILTLLDKVRNHCLTQKSFIDPTADSSRSTNRPSSLSQEAQEPPGMFQIFGYRAPSWALALANILSTPRRLKHVLRDIVQQWEILIGEVDLDELIIVTALRHSAPAVFTFFGIHFEEFEKVTSAPNAQLTIKDREEIRQQRLEYLKQEWGRACISDGIDPQSLGVVLGSIVWSSTKITGVEIWDKGNRAQSISGSRGTIYWDRVVSGAIDQKDVRDQEVLSAIFKLAACEEIEKFGARFAQSSEFAERVIFFEKFQSRIAVECMLKAASFALEYLRPFDRLLGSEQESYYHLRIWLGRNTYDNSLFADWLEGEFRKRIPRNLAEANVLFLDLGPNQMAVESLFSLRKRCISFVRGALAGIQPDDFAKCFVPSYPYTLCQFIRFGEGKYPVEFLTNAGDWTWISDILIAGMKEYPSILVPQVAYIFGNDGPEGGVPTWFKFDERSMAALFGNRKIEAYSLLSQDYEIPQNMWPKFKYVAPLISAEANRLAKVELEK